ncbi:hypothetical protein HaLaN_05718, partial [Haematococcus lacustris]
MEVRARAGALACSPIAAACSVPKKKGPSSEGWAGRRKVVYQLLQPGLIGVGGVMCTTSSTRLA